MISPHNSSLSEAKKQQMFNLEHVSSEQCITFLSKLGIDEASLVPNINEVSVTGLGPCLTTHQTCPTFYRFKPATDIQPVLELVMQEQSVQEQRKAYYDVKIETIREAAEISPEEFAERRAIQEKAIAEEVGDFLDGSLESVEKPVRSLSSPFGAILGYFL